MTPRRDRSLTHRLREQLGQPVDGASLAIFRIAFGAVLTWEVWRYFHYDWIRYYWIEPPFHFTYLGFSWLQPWPGNGMYIHFAVLGVTAAAVMIGCFTRVAAPILALAFAYVFLLDKARYLNHFYLISLFALLVAIVPAHRVWSLDAFRTRRAGGHGAASVPAWSLWILRFQMGVVYAFAGIAKFDDGWLGGHVFSARFATEGGPIFGALAESEFVVMALALGGLLFDLLIVPLLLWHRTRLVAFGAAMLFHLTNAFTFDIGIFPWLAIAATTLFLRPDWPRVVLHRLGRWPASDSAEKAHVSRGRIHPISRPLFAVLTTYVVIQLLVPVRHVLYPGEVDWNQRGHRFSWRMKLHAVQGFVRMRVVNGSDTTLVDPANYLPDFQTSTMARYPGMILQFAHYVADRFQKAGRRSVEVYADAVVALDGDAASFLIDPRVDLASQNNAFGSAPWILPQGRLPY